MFANILKNIAIKAEAAYALVLKYNPYHDEKGRFAKHSAATFVSLQGKKYADILDPKNQYKNQLAVQHQMQKAKTSAYHFGITMRDGGSPGQSSLDAANLAGNMAKAYAKHTTLFGGYEGDKLVAEAFLKAHLSTKDKQSLSIPLTAEEEAMVMAGLKTQTDKKSAKAKEKALKAYAKAYYTGQEKNSKLMFKNQYAKADLEVAKVTKLKEAALAAGATPEEIYNIAMVNMEKKDAYQKAVKDDLTAKALAYYKQKQVAESISHSAYPTTYDEQHQIKDALKAEADKLYKDNKYFLDGTLVSLTKDAKEQFAEWKTKKEAGYKQVADWHAEDSITNSAYQLAKHSMMSEGWSEYQLAEIAASSAPKNTAQATHDEKMAKQAAESAKYNSLKNVKNAAIVYHTGLLAGNTDLAPFKASLQKHLDEAEALGVSTHEIKLTEQEAQKIGQKNIDTAKSTIKATAKDYAYAMYQARLKGDTAEEADNAAYLHNHIEDNKNLMSAADVKEVKASAKSTATKEHEAMKNFVESNGKIMASAAETAKNYDATANTFHSVLKDPEFAEQQNAMIENLPYGAKQVLTSYTGSGYQDINKAAGKYGTEKMMGLEPEPLTGYAKTSIKSMDQAFAQIKLGKNVKLRRNMPQRYFFGQLGVPVDKLSGLTEEKAQAFIGKVYKETAYGSASMDHNFNSVYSKESDKTGKIKLNIRAHADTNAVRVASISGHKSEEEVIMGRGTTYVIRAVRKGPHGYAFEVDVDVIGTYPDPIN